MARPDAITAEVADAALGDLPGWRADGDRLVVAYRFTDFETAMAFMVAVAPHARELDHHPEWRNVYNRVEIELTTHDLGGLSELDLELAARMVMLAERFGGTTA